MKKGSERDIYHRLDDDDSHVRRTVESLVNSHVVAAFVNGFDHRNPSSVMLAINAAIVWVNRSVLRLTPRLDGSPETPNENERCHRRVNTYSQDSRNETVSNR